MKKQALLSIVWSLALCFILGTGALAADQTDSFHLTVGNTAAMTAQGKADFAEDVKERWEKVVQDGEALPYDADAVDGLLLEAALAKEGADRESSLKALESYGVYQYPAKPLENGTTSADTDSIRVGDTDVYYAASEDVWIVTSSGSWLTDSWKEEKGFGEELGGFDGFGVVFTDSENYDSHVVRSIGVLQNGYTGDARRERTTYNRSDGDQKGSFGFRLQDYVTKVPDPAGGKIASYVGKEWFAACTYSSEFVNCEGAAAGYYVRTWDKAVIEDITFGVSGKPAGMDVTMGSSTAFSPLAWISRHRMPFLTVVLLGGVTVAAAIYRRKMPGTK